MSNNLKEIINDTVTEYDYYLLNMPWKMSLPLYS